MNTINRREFLGAASAIGIAGCLSAQSGMEQLWGGSVVDVHHHFRPVLEANIVHLDGCGVSNALVLARQNTIEQVKELGAKYPSRILGFAASTDVTKEDAAKLLTQAVKDGAHGFGEIKFHVASDSPEMRRMYALAAELKVPIMIHFQEVPHTPTEGVFNTGFKQFEAMLKAFPKTTFVGHADAFWANVSADYNNEVAYPSGPIKRGGVTDKLLSDYGNLFGDLSANSGNNALSRDADFTKDFLARHQDKLMFGSDCSCTDGKGGGISQNNNPTAARLSGKCVARETLTVLKKSASPSAFRKMTWTNSHKVYQIATT
jgi:uncharacterized protein